MRPPEIPNIPIPPATELPKVRQGFLNRILQEVEELAQEKTEVHEAELAEVPDSFQLSASGRSFEAARELVERTIFDLSLRKDLSPEALRAAGADEYQQALDEATDLSPEGAAGLIVEGITGHIFKAYEASQPELGAAELTRFQELAQGAIRRGHADATRNLEERGLHDARIATEAATTVKLAGTGVDRFVANRLETAAPVGSEP